ncbi:hypothetical protein Trydic_g19458 [Trypoxylus dichotomus]
MDPDFPEVDVMGEYKAIHNKFLKKRFFRKPNIPAAREAYKSLAYHCQREELPEHAAMCWKATAKCERDMGNLVGERACHVKAAKQYMSEEIQDYDHGFFSPFKENLQNALQSYEQASNTYPSDSPMQISLNLTMANSLDRVGVNSLQSKYLQNASDVIKDDCQVKLDCLSRKASNCLENGDLESALETYTELADVIDNLEKDYVNTRLLMHSEISRVLILMLLKPSPDLLDPKLAQLLDRYTWGKHTDEHFKEIDMPIELFILMQSLVLACQSCDPYSSLVGIEHEFWVYLDVQQKDLLRTLVRTYQTLPVAKVSDASIKADKKQQKPQNEVKRPEEDNSSKFDGPQTYSTQGITRKIKIVEKIEARKGKGISDMDKNQHLILGEKITKQVNFPYEQPIYKDLIPLCVKMQSQPMIASRKPLPLKDKEPVLNDFFVPRKTPEYNYKVSNQIANKGQMRQYRGLKLHRVMENWCNDEG